MHDHAGIGFDLDGTLVEPFSATPYAEAQARLEGLRFRVTRIFVATNQAGPVYRAMLHDAKYPTAEDTAERIVRAAQALSLGDVPWYLATWHGNNRIWADEPAVVAAWASESARQSEQLGRAIHRLAPDLEFYVHGSPFWRKPLGGMLDAAAAHLSIGFGDLTYVGDLDTDEAAARDIGAAYVDAVQWRAGQVRL